MSFFNTVMSVKKATLTNGCKRYYEYLAKNLLKASQINNWRVLSGKYTNHHFIIAKDKKIAEQLGISVQSIYNYKKTLKSLGLINTLPKFTTRTNQCKNNHFCQLTVVLKTIPKWLISETLVFKNNIKKARILKTSSNIISQFSKNLNNTIRNIHKKVKKLLNNVKITNYTNNISYNNLKNLDKEGVQTVANTLNTYNIKFKNNEIPHYIEMYEKSKEKFIQTCKYCSDKYMYAPLKYFTKVFESSKTYINKFWNFPQREYDFDELEKMIIHNLN